MELVTTILGGILFSLLLFILYLRRNHGTLEAQGIPVDKPYLFFGSPPFFWNKVNVHEHYLAMVKKHGYTWGRYQGTTPVLNTIDPVLLKEILVKKFEHFVDTFDTTGFPDRHLTMDLVGGERWRIIRRILTPTFTSGKLKGMAAPLQTSVNITAEKLKKLAGSKEGVNVKDVWQEMALDSISKCAFSTVLDRNVAKGSEGEHFLVKFSHEIATLLQIPDSVSAFFQQLVYHLPWFQRFFPMFPEQFENLFGFVNGIFTQREEAYKNNAPHTPDYVSTLVELNEQRKKDPNLGKHLNRDCIVTQGSVFVLGGLETVSSAMTNITFILATHPEFQEQLHQEVLACVEEADGKVPTTESINELQLLDAIIKESLRLAPPITQYQRICTKDIVLSNGLKVKEGTMIHIPIYAAHHHPDFFQEPEKFKPERFFKENEANIDPMAYRPFGMGPRACIGMRFALMEIKLALTILLSQFRFVKRPDTKNVPELGDMFLMQIREVKVDVEARG